jgi:ADP-ribosylglycohydrolase
MADAKSRMNRVRLALDGLSVGDALGEQFFHPDGAEMLARRILPESYWFYTDDTEMALGIAEVLESCGQIDQDELARVFARRYRRNPRRGYGATAHEILAGIHAGTPWRSAAGRAFGGEGSMGNGAAMRVAPVGAYFADDYGEVVTQAARSAEVTHAHPEGVAGAIAVAVAAAWAWRWSDGRDERAGLLETVLAHTPEGKTREGIETAATLEADCSVERAARVLGNGSGIVAPDTVPLCLWLAARHHTYYEEAIWSTISAWGDVDTNCAIVGGIVALANGWQGIPKEWLRRREELA